SALRSLLATERTCDRVRRNDADDPQQTITGLSLFFAFPYDPAKVDFPGRRYARSWCGLDEQLVAFEPETSPLFRTVPAFVPRCVNGGNKFITFDPVFARVGKHGFVKRCAFGISLPGRATFGSGDRHGASLACHNKVAVRLWPKEVFCTVLRDHLPRDEFPVANQMFGTHKPALRKRVAFAALHRNVGQNNQFRSWPRPCENRSASPHSSGRDDAFHRPSIF